MLSDEASWLTPSGRPRETCRRVLEVALRFVESATFSVAFCGDGAYPFAAAGDDRMRIADAIRGATTACPPLVAALTRGDLSARRVELAEADLASLAAKTEEISSVHTTVRAT